VDRVEPGVGVAPVGAEEAHGPVDVHAELGFLLAGGGVRVRLGIVDVGVQAQGAADGLARLAGQAGNILELGLALDVEQADAGRDRLADLPVGLADAGVDDFSAVGPDGAGAGKLAAADDVEAAAGLGQELEDMKVRKRLYRKADRRRELANASAIAR